MLAHVIPRPAHRGNWSLRPSKSVIDCLVLHDTGGRTAEGALRWFASPEAKVSVHYVVDTDGTVYGVVPEEDGRAWHAGASSLWGKSDLNSRSIGIEIVDPDDAQPYPPAQMRALIELTADIAARRGIWLNRIVGHEHVGEPPGRKVDPGRDFPWERFLLAVGIEVNRLRGGMVEQWLTAGYST